MVGWIGVASRLVFLALFLVSGRAAIPRAYSAPPYFSAPVAPTSALASPRGVSGPVAGTPSGRGIEQRELQRLLHSAQGRALMRSGLGAALLSALERRYGGVRPDVSAAPHRIPPFSQPLMSGPAPQATERGQFALAPVSSSAATSAGRLHPFQAGMIRPRVVTPIHISSVQASGSGSSLHVVVTGAGFGAAPVAMPYTGDTDYFKFTDTTAGWDAGYNAPGNPNRVTLKYQSWSDTQIVIDGFAGRYADPTFYNFTYSPGDGIGVWVKSQSSDTFASWPPAPSCVNGVCSTSIPLDAYLNNAGIATAAVSNTTNFDGAGSAYAAEALSAAFPVSLTYGATVVYSNTTFQWPSGPAGANDNVIANGQVVPLGDTTFSSLSILGASSYAAPAATGAITYTDGTTGTYTLDLTDWMQPDAAPYHGNSVVAQANYRYAYGSQDSATNAIFNATIPLTAKKVSAIVLPAKPGGLAEDHIFALSGIVGTPPIATSTATPISTSTTTPTSTSTTTPTSTSTTTPTSTSTTTPTSTSTTTPTSTAPTDTATSTTTTTSTGTAIATVVPIAAATSTGTAIATVVPTTIATETTTPPPTATNTAVPIGTATTITNTEPTGTATATATATATSAASVIPTVCTPYHATVAYIVTISGDCPVGATVSHVTVGLPAVLGRARAITLPSISLTDRGAPALPITLRPSRLRWSAWP